MVLTRERRRTAPAPGGLAIASGLIGFLLAVEQLVLPSMVPADQFSAPATPALFTVSASLLFLVHLAVVPATVVVARATGSRLGRTGGAVASIGTVGLAIAELVSVAAAPERGTTAVTDAVETGYGPPSVLVGAGMILLGAAVLRSRLATGPLPLVIGVFVFVPLLPAVIVGEPFQMLALAVWSLLYTAFGTVLLRRPIAGVTGR